MTVPLEKLVSSGKGHAMRYLVKRMILKGTLPLMVAAYIVC